MTDIAHTGRQARAMGLPKLGRARGLVNAAIGMAGLLALWWLGGRYVANNPDMMAFASFAPAPTLARLVDMVASGEVIDMALPSLSRVGYGLAYATAIGVPTGILVGRGPRVHEITNVPFQFLRMISPLAWMPIAVMVFATWDAAIIFLLTMAAVWPILFSTAAGVRRIDPAWLKVARNLGAAEYLGVTSGLGYAINDARDTLDYSSLAATVVVIGMIGFTLDALAGLLVKKFNWMRGGQ